MNRPEIFNPFNRKPKAESVGFDNDAFYNTRAWRRFSKWYLANNQLCVECEKEGKYVVATDTDHKIPVRERPDLRFDPSNCQALCKFHHGKKTASGK